MPGPVAPARPPRGRLDTLNTNKHAPRFGGRIAQSRLPTAAAVPSPPRAPATKQNDCPHTTTVEHGNSKVCDECGVVLQESDIVAEITFGETAAGAAVVQGGFVGEGQRHANTMGGTVRGMPGRESRQKTQQRGQDEIAALCYALRLTANVKDAATQYYKLSLNHEFEDEDRTPFGQGRRVRNVAAVCIYLADRKQPESTLLLMDLAEKVRVNVFALGHTYKELLKMLGEVDPENEPKHNGDVVQQLEPLVFKFCRKLEFGRDDRKVASDAVLLLKRMKRDWMIQGRQPAGIIGACIILAARMNNYRRTVREVVYVVRVCDSTLHQRLHEFKRTQASTLSVRRFREVGLKLKVNIDPPSVYKRKAKEYRKRKRAVIDAGGEWHSEEESLSGTPVPSPQDSTAAASPAPRKKQKTKASTGAAIPTPPATQSQSQLRQDADGFAIPNAPSQIEAMLDPESTDHHDLLAQTHGSRRVEDADQEPAQPEAPAQKRKRGRPRNEPTVVSERDIEIEEDIEKEMESVIKNWEAVFLEFRNNPEHPLLKATKNRAERLNADYMPNTDYSNENDAELDEDPEVADCLNTKEETALKEKIWITENEEWLRRQQQKMLQKELEQASGKKKVVRRRRHYQMGDGSLLEGKSVSSAAEAAKAMVDQHAKSSRFSKNIDYEVLYALGSGRPDAAESPDTPSLAGTPSATAGASPEGAQQKGKQKAVEVEEEYDDEDAEADWDEDYEEQPGATSEFRNPFHYGYVEEEVQGAGDDDGDL